MVIGGRGGSGTWEVTAHDGGAAFRDRRDAQPDVRVNSPGRKGGSPGRLRLGQAPGPTILCANARSYLLRRGPAAQLASIRRFIRDEYGGCDDDLTGLNFFPGRLAAIFNCHLDLTLRLSLSKAGKANSFNLFNSFNPSNLPPATSLVACYPPPHRPPFRPPHFALTRVGEATKNCTRHENDDFGIGSQAGWRSSYD
jgi:hypothetical protein